MAKLFYASFVMLFAETMAIRWLGIEIPVLRAFPNLILMLVFIGASAGIAQPEKRAGKVRLLLSILFLVASVIVVPQTALKDLSLRIDETNSPLAVITSLILMSFSLLTVFLYLLSALPFLRKDKEQTNTNAA